MKLTTKLLLGGIAVVGATAALFVGCHLTSQHHVNKTVAEGPALWVNPFTKSSPAYKETENYRQWLSVNRKLSDATGALSLTDKLKVSNRLMDEGAARLPTDLLEQRLSSVSKILASLNTQLCGKYVKGKLSLSEFERQVYPVIESFDDAEARAWFTVNKASIEARLNAAPIVILSAKDAEQTVLKLANSMYEPQSKEFIAGLGRLKAASDDDACKTARVLYGRGNSLPEPYRGYMARILLTGAEGHQKL